MRVARYTSYQADERLIGHNHDESSLSPHHRPPDCSKADDTLKAEPNAEGDSFCRFVR